MKDNRGGEKYLDMYPKLKKWINTCSCCHDRGYNPTMPEKITAVNGSVDVNNIKKLFKPLELNEKGLCKVCERILTIALLICMSLSLACCNTNTNTKPTVDSSNQSDNTGIANSSSDNTSSDNVNQNKSLLIDETDFDINNDQTTEHLSMEYGGTSGLFTFVFTVQEQGNYYKTFFNTDHYEFSFAEKEGTMQVKAQHDDTTTYFDIDFNANSPLITLRQGETVLSGVYMPYRQAHTLDEYNAVEQLVRDWYKEHFSNKTIKEITTDNSYSAYSHYDINPGNILVFKVTLGKEQPRYCVFIKDADNQWVFKTEGY